MRIGVGRVSTLDQNLDAQHDALLAAGCDPSMIFVDKMTGRTSDRPGLQQALRAARSGDQIVVTKLDRLGRSRKDIYRIFDDLEERGIDLVILSPSIDTSTIGGQIVFAVMAALAQGEANLIRERTLEGLAAARRRGRVGGRKPKLTEQKLRDALRYREESDATWEQVAREYGVAPSTLHAARKRLEDRQGS
jgi:DNA invertase Pin-like site-specific DNA recombinase